MGRTERARQLALVLVVMSVPGLTLYAQIVGQHTTAVGVVYGVVMLAVLRMGRARLTPLVEPAWKPQTLVADPPSHA